MDTNLGHGRAVNSSLRAGVTVFCRTGEGMEDLELFSLQLTRIHLSKECVIPPAPKEAPAPGR